MCMRKRTEVTVVAALIAAIFAWPSYAMWRNYHGYCADLGRYLTDQEFIDAAIDEVLSSVRAFGRSTKLEPSVIVYRDRESFLRVNPECCEREGRYRDEGPRPMSLWKRITGYQFTWVAVRYKERELYSDGRREDKTQRGYFFLDSCGIQRDW